MKRTLITPFLLLYFFATAQQKLQPGFDPREYAELLSLTFYNKSNPDSSAARSNDPYRMVYRSPESGFRNRWTLYLRNDKVASIDMRGTIGHIDSWMANFYAAMIPATGTLQLNDSTSYNYSFATDPKAMVHVGWAISVAHLAPDIVSNINYLYKTQQVKEYLIFGHSQGGALAFLVRACLESEKKQGHIPADVIFKTYCSAGPKPGNMYFAYEFDFITRGGWGFNVVNTADWVPETPFSIQTLNDFNPTNPLIHTRDALKKQKLFVRVAGGMIYNKLEKAPRKAQKKFEKYLGSVLYKKGVKDILPQLRQPEYAPGNNYMRAGIPIILAADSEYHQQFPESDEHYFVHHLYRPYYYLLNKWYPK